MNRVADDLPARFRRGQSRRELLATDGLLTGREATLAAALDEAKAAAGDKNVGIWGGANIIQQCLRAGLVDEMQIHLVPVLLGDGNRLFEQLGPERIELERTGAIDTPSPTHLRLTVVN
jgi:dihydrofolate reductase